MVSTNEPDMSFLSELYETIERSPPGIEARKLLIQHFDSIGWQDAAREATLELSKISPNDSEVKALIASFTKTTAKPPPPPDTRGSMLTVAESPSIQRHTRLPPSRPQGSGDQAAQERRLREDYEALLARARVLLRETNLLRDLTQDDASKSLTSTGSSDYGSAGSLFDSGGTKHKDMLARLEKNVTNIAALADGKVDSVIRVKRPPSVPSVVKSMQLKPTQAMEIAFEDLKAMARWLSSSEHNSPVVNDSVREALVTRVKTMQALLIDNLKTCALNAFMHIEHEVLLRKYVGGDSTMLGDDVADIPRSNFLCTEDGYAWDMSELSQAIKSNGGVMRNPLSHQMFTTNDIRSIIRHPLGKHLAQLEIEQKKLKQGVRTKTIEQLDKLQAVLLSDQSADAIPSRRAVDEFLSFLATLPDTEQQAIDKLRVPATDSHTGQKFDTSIGENLRDAQGNRVCFHKTGDLIRQAVAHLRK